MTNEERSIIFEMQRAGKGYRAIATETGLPLNSVKSWCRRHPIDIMLPHHCRSCGTELSQNSGKRMKLFCSDSCRLRWWANHPEARRHRVEYKHVCSYCGKTFVNDRIRAAYCGRDCFAKARMTAGTNG